MTASEATPAGAGAILLAAGDSVRLSGPVPKPFRHLAGRPVLEYSLAAFAAAAGVASIVIVVPGAQRESVAQSCSGAPRVCAVAAGGPTRQESVARGLACLPAGLDVVAVHDAARPLITPALIDAVLSAVGGGFDGAIAAVPLDDAVKEVGDAGQILRPRSRAGLWRAQTPQAFRRSCLQDSLDQALTDAVPCDDCSEMATRAGYRVRVVLGDPRNIKLTRPADLEVCERLLGGGGVAPAGAVAVAAATAVAVAAAAGRPGA